VEEAVAVGDLVRVLTFRQGEANLVEVTLPEDTPLAGRPVKALMLPADSALVVILRGGRVIVPQNDVGFEPGDELLFVATSAVEENIRAAVSLGAR
jgi:trk system potassium uptake protein TrkA